MRVSAIALATLLPASVFAVFQDEAFVNDWHIALLGPSLPASSFFHRPVLDAKASLIYTLSERNILAAVHPKDGAVVWRHQLDISCSLEGISRAADGKVVTSACGELKAFDAVAGKLVWEHDFAGGKVQDVQIVDRENGGGVVVLMTDNTVKMLDGESGHIKWQWRGPDSYVLFHAARKSAFG